MVYAFIIQTLDGEQPELAYYRCYSTKVDNTEERNSTSPDNREFDYIFMSSLEKKDFLSFHIKKVHMHYSLKLKQSLLPIQHQDSKTIIKGYYMETEWKSAKLIVVWEGVPGLGFSLICAREANISHAQNILDLIVSQLEKYLQLVTYPSITPKIIDSVALIVDTFLPGGQILFLNSSLIKSMEKQIEINLQH